MKNPDTESCRVMVKGPRCQALVAWRSFVLDNPFHRTNFSWVLSQLKKARLKSVLETPSANEFVATAVNSKNETRLFRVWFQLLSEMDDLRIDCPRVGIVLISPHRVQKPIPAERFAGMRDKVGEQGELFGREINLFAGAQHCIAADVDLDIAESIDLRRRRWR